MDVLSQHCVDGSEKEVSQEIAVIDPEVASQSDNYELDGIMPSTFSGVEGITNGQG